MEIKDYVRLEGRTYGKYAYPDLLVSAEPVSEVRGMGTKSRRYEGNHFALTLRQTVDFMLLVNSGNLFDEAGNKLSSSRVDSLSRRLYHREDGDYKAECTGTVFQTLKGGRLKVIYDKINPDGTLTRVEEAFEGGDSLMEDRMPGINIRDWLKNATDLGLPHKSVGIGDLWYLGPRGDRQERSIASIGIYSRGPFLYCSANPLSTNRRSRMRLARLPD